LHHLKARLCNMQAFVSPGRGFLRFFCLKAEATHCTREDGQSSPEMRFQSE